MFDDILLYRANFKLFFIEIHFYINELTLEIYKFLTQINKYVKKFLNQTVPFISRQICADVPWAETNVVVNKLENNPPSPPEKRKDKGKV
jgi:hypothetical protein